MSSEQELIALISFGTIGLLVLFCIIGMWTERNKRDKDITYFVKSVLMAIVVCPGLLLCVAAFAGIGFAVLVVVITITQWVGIL